MVISKVRRNIHHILSNYISNCISNVNIYCWLVEYCWSHHTKYVVTVIKTLIAPLHTKEAKSLRWPVPVSSVQCRAVAAEQNLINLPSAETEPIFHFHSSPHFCCRHGHGTHNPHQRRQSNMFGNQTGFNNFKETLVVKVLERSTAPALVRHVVAALCLYHHFTITITAMTPSVTSLTLAP